MDDALVQAFFVGVDYQPIDDERRCGDWYELDYPSDFSAIAEAGLRRVRLTCAWRLMEPQVGQYDEAVFARLDALIAAAAAAGLEVVLCLFAHDSVAALSEVPWATGRDAFTDTYLFERQAEFARHLASRYKGEPAVVAWELADAAYLRGFITEPALEAWTLALRSAVRAIDEDRPLRLGIDAETHLRATGVDARPAIDLCEEAAVAPSPEYVAYAVDGASGGRMGSHLDGFLLHLALDELPVVAESIGPRDLEGSSAQDLVGLRTGLYSALMNGASGAMLRRWRGLLTEPRAPYHVDPEESLAGVLLPDGTPTAMLAEVRRFAEVAAAVGCYELVPERVAVLVPTERYQVLPSLAGIRTPRTCLAAYVAAKEAHLPVTVVREGDRVLRARVIIVPGACALGAETWRSLTAFVQAGGAAVLSYGGGDADPALREIFGVEFLGDDGPRTSLSCRVAQPDLLPGVTNFASPVPVPHFARLGAGSATVVATDHDGAPLVTLRQYGQGRALFVAAPLERILAEADPAAVPEAVWSLVRGIYAGLAGATGAVGALRCDRPDVEFGHFIGTDDDIVVLLNHADVAQSATLVFPREVADVSDACGGTPVRVASTAFGVPLGASGVAALRVTYRSDAG
jgi:endo-1,4-beta-mannosidase